VFAGIKRKRLPPNCQTLTHSAVALAYTPLHANVRDAGLIVPALEASHACKTATGSQGLNLSAQPSVRQIMSYQNTSLAWGGAKHPEIKGASAEMQSRVRICNVTLFLGGELPLASLSTVNLMARKKPQ